MATHQSPPEYFCPKCGRSHGGRSLMGIWVCQHCPWEPMVSNEPLFGVSEFEVLESFDQLKDWGFKNPCAEVALEVSEADDNLMQRYSDTLDPNNKIQRWPQEEE